MLEAFLLCCGHLLCALAAAGAVPASAVHLLGHKESYPSIRAIPTARLGGADQPLAMTNFH